MTTRTARKSVTFSHPFSLDGIDGVQPAGTYEVDTDEELISDTTFLAYRRIGTTIHLNRNGMTQIYPVDPVDLDASLLRDADLTIRPQGGK